MKNGDFSLRSGLALGHELLSADARPPAIFASNDDMALGVLMAAMKLGVTVPDTLSVAGFDDAPSARAAWPLLTTVRQPKAEMAATAVDILVDPHYRADMNNPKFKLSLPYQIIERDSAKGCPFP